MAPVVVVAEANSSAHLLAGTRNVQMSWDCLGLLGSSLGVWVRRARVVSFCGAHGRMRTSCMMHHTLSYAMSGGCANAIVRHRAPSRGSWTGTRARGQATVPTPVTETSSMLHRLTHRASHTLQVGAAPSGVPWRPRGFGASVCRVNGWVACFSVSVDVLACVSGVSRGDVRAAVGMVGGKASQEDGDVLCVRAVQGLCSPREGGGVEMGEGPHAGA